VGGVIAGVVVLLLAIAALLYYLRISRRTLGHSAPDADVRGPGGKWNGLSSRDSTMEGGLHGPKSSSKAQRFTRQHADSMGAIVSPNESSTGHGKETAEDDDVSLGEELKVGNRRSEYIETVPPLSFNDVRNSMALASPPPDDGAHRRGRKSSTSQSQNHHAVALAKLNMNAGLTTPPHARQRSVDGTGYTGSPYSGAFPPLPRGTPTSPSTPSSPLSAEAMQRTSSSGMRRNPTRKPVPSYHSAASAGLATDPVVPTPRRSLIVDGDSSGSSTPTRGPTPSRSGEDLGVRRPHVPDLNHKSSFGDARPMHFLVPDLPPTGASRE